jgi:hypothetical protein
MNIYEIEQAITELSPNELARFRQWFEEKVALPYDMTEFDALIKQARNQAKEAGLKQTNHHPSSQRHVVINERHNS